METLVGFAIGYLAGASAGKQGLNQLRESWVAIRKSGQIRELMGEAAAAAGPVIRGLARATQG